MSRQETQGPDPVLILDGGTGSELRRRGVGLSSACWSGEANLDHAELLYRIHCDYICAGADIVTANTFATTRFVLEAAGLDDRFEAINRSAVEAAQRAAAAAGRDVTVAASLSCLPPSFDTRAYPDAESEYRGYVELADLFAENGVDLVLAEMMQNPPHAARACRAISQSGLPFWIGVSCRRDAESGRLVSFDDPGIPFDDVLEAVSGFEPTGFSIMHTPVDAVSPALQALSAFWQGPVGAYAELPYAEDPDAPPPVVRTSPDRYAAAAREWLIRGVRLIGGCCGTTPAHIEALRRLIDVNRCPR